MNILPQAIVVGTIAAFGVLMSSKFGLHAWAMFLAMADRLRPTAKLARAFTEVFPRPFARRQRFPYVSASLRTCRASDTSR